MSLPWHMMRNVVQLGSLAYREEMRHTKPPQKPEWQVPEGIAARFSNGNILFFGKFGQLFFLFHKNFPNFLLKHTFCETFNLIKAPSKGSGMSLLELATLCEHLCYAVGVDWKADMK